MEADKAAKFARDNPRPFSSLEFVKRKTLDLTARLLMDISVQLASAQGPSESDSDRLSSATADQDSDDPSVPVIHLS